MLRYLLGIFTALLCVAAFVVWTSLPGNVPTTDGTTTGTPAPQSETTDDAGADGATLTPKTDDPATTRGLELNKAAETGNAVMRAEVVPTLGFSMDVPESWVTLDANGLRRYFSEVQGMTDGAQVNQLISTIVLGTIQKWPETGGTANVMVNHRLAPRREVLPILNAMLDQKRAALQSVEVMSPAAQGQLGPFWGASVRTRETSGTGDQAETREVIFWLLRVGEGYMVISAEAPAGDTDALALIEKMLASVKATGS